MTETITALYRKYRPETFDDVRNQEHITTVLQGSIKKGIIPHALLFTGSRGTGKTTVARIFARAIGASDIDTYEIDAASNRGIDEIRALKDTVHTLPYESPYKVYLIDEVHMLTKEAFNALLKTLEEPPAHVIFILATTEQDKLLPTIVSRCQLFQFRSPNRAELKEAVLAVAKKEKFSLNEQGAELIAIAADGSFRDALGITQKVITASPDAKADADEVASIVGAPKSALITDVLMALAKKDAERGIAAIRNASEQNADMRLFARLLLERMRTVMLIRHSSRERNLRLSEYGPEEQAVLAELADDAHSPLNSRLLLRFLEAAEHIGKAYVPELPLELAIIESCTPS